MFGRQAFPFELVPFPGTLVSFRGTTPWKFNDIWKFAIPKRKGLPSNTGIFQGRALKLNGVFKSFLFSPRSLRKIPILKKKVVQPPTVNSPLIRPYFLGRGCHWGGSPYIPMTRKTSKKPPGAGHVWKPTSRWSNLTDGTQQTFGTLVVGQTPFFVHRKLQGWGVRMLIYNITLM